MTPNLAFLLIAAVFATAAIALVREARKEAARKTEALVDCAHLLGDAQPSVGPSGWGALRGSADGRSAALTAIAEMLVFRRLPQLWISAAVRSAAAGGTVAIVRRPSGSEFFTGANRLPIAVAPPPGWPSDTSVKCDESGVRLLGRLEDLLAGTLADPKLKAVTISPKGVRVIRQAAQGKRGAYALFRDARFSPARVPAEQAEQALRLALALAERLESDGRERRAA